MRNGRDLFLYILIISIVHTIVQTIFIGIFDARPYDFLQVFRCKSVFKPVSRTVCNVSAIFLHRIETGTVNGLSRRIDYRYCFGNRPGCSVCLPVMLMI